MFEQQQTVDITKSLKCIEEKYNLIRIDYTQIGHIASHIESALMANRRYYFSTHIINAIDI